MAWKCSVCHDIDLAKGMQNDGNCMRCGAKMRQLTEESEE